MRGRASAAWGACALLAGCALGCTPGLDAPTAAADARAVAAADADRLTDDARPALQDAAPRDDAAPPDDARSAPDDATADAGPDDAAEPPPEPCEALAAATCTPLLDVDLGRAVRAVRVVHPTADDTLIAATTDDGLRVYQIRERPTVTATVVWSAPRPAGEPWVGLTVAADDAGWIAYAITADRVVCGSDSLRVGGAATTSRTRALAELRGVHARSVGNYGLRAVAWRGSGVMTQVHRWTEWGCADLDTDTMIVGLPAPPHDLQILPRASDDEAFALANADAPVAGAYLGLYDLLAATRWPLAQPVAHARIAAASAGNVNDLVAAFTTRTATTANAVLQTLRRKANDGTQPVAGPRQLVRGEVAASTCSGDCAAIAYTPARSPLRVEVMFLTKGLVLRGAGPVRAGCTAEPPSSLDLHTESGRLVIGWAAGQRVTVQSCETP